MESKVETMFFTVVDQLFAVVSFTIVWSTISDMTALNWKLLQLKTIGIVNYYTVPPISVIDSSE